MDLQIEKAHKHPTKWIKKKKCDIHIHTIEYGSAIKRNEIMLSAATMLDLETIILRRKKTYICYHRQI